MKLTYWEVARKEEEKRQKEEALKFFKKVSFFK